MTVRAYLTEEDEQAQKAGQFLMDMQISLDHGIIVSRLARMVAEELNQPEEFCYDMAQAGLLHDIGKLRLSKYLYSSEKNTMRIEKMNYIRKHPVFGYEILKNEGYNDMIATAIYHHHENFDGSGYPDNLKGEAIPLGARILRICDVFAALCSERPYRSAFPVDFAMEMLIDEYKNFDMEIFLAMQRVLHSDGFEDLRSYIYDANNIARTLKAGRKIHDNTETQGHTGLVWGEYE